MRQRSPPRHLIPRGNNAFGYGHTPQLANTAQCYHPIAKSIVEKLIILLNFRVPSGARLGAMRDRPRFPRGCVHPAPKFPSARHWGAIDTGPAFPRYKKLDGCRWKGWGWWNSIHFQQTSTSTCQIFRKGLVREGGEGDCGNILGKPRGAEVFWKNRGGENLIAVATRAVSLFAANHVDASRAQFSFFWLNFSGENCEISICSAKIWRKLVVWAGFFFGRVFSYFRIKDHVIFYGLTQVSA